MKKTYSELLGAMMIILAGMGFHVGGTILVFMYGWGLKPQSWWWIIGMYFILHTVGYAFVKIGSNIAKPTD